MRYFLRDLLFFTLFFYVSILQVHAEDIATVRVPEALEVLFVDGAEYSQAMFRSGDIVLTLTEGLHTVVLQYKEIFSAGDEMDKVKSRPFSVSFMVAEKAQFQLVLPVIQNAMQAKAYVKKPSLLLKQGEQEQALSLVFSLDNKVALDYASKINQASSGQPIKQSEAAQQLRYWWLKLTAAEQQAFLNDVRQ